MEVDKRQILQEDRISDCRSFGSNFHPSSQSRKISVGILIDSLENKRSRAIKQDNIIATNAERVNSDKRKSVEGKNKEKCIIDPNERKQTEAPEKVYSPWINTRSFHPKTTASPTTSGRKNKPSRVQDAKITHPVQFFTNSIPVTGSDGGKQKKFDGLTYKRKGGNESTSQKPEGFISVSAQEVHASDKAAINSKKEEGRTETLRIKLQEILGTVSSPRSQPSNEVCEARATNLKSQQIYHQKGDAVFKPIQSSDSIETNSENPDCTIKRPVTHSFTRKRVTTKAQQVKRKTVPSSSHKQKIHGANIFSFEEGIEKGDDATGVSSMSGRKKGTGKSSGIEPCRISFTEVNNAATSVGATCRSGMPPPAEKAPPFEPWRAYFTKKNTADEIHEATCRSTMPPFFKKSSSLSHKIGGVHGCSSKNECLEQKKRNAEDSHQSAKANRVDLSGDLVFPFVPVDDDQHEELDDQDLKNATEPKDELQSPTSKINTPTLSSSPGSTPKTDQLERRVYSPLEAERRSTLGNIRSFRNLLSSKADCSVSNTKVESSVDAEEHKDSPPNNPFPFKENEAMQEGLTESSSEDEDSQCSIEGFKETDVFPGETTMDKRSNSMLFPSKRLYGQKGNIVSKFSPILPSEKGINENHWNPEPSEQNQENEMERVITLFAMALENFQNKMKSATRKKSSEILVSVSEEIHLQLTNVQSQIQTDVGKLTSISKSKRKRLETKFQEQQDNLKLIHDRFKQDIHLHLQDCKSTVDELDMHHIELKGTMKKQKASHQKLLMQVEEAVETRLDNAQRRITAVNMSAKEKMLQFQHIIAECLNEGMQS